MEKEPPDNKKSKKKNERICDDKMGKMEDSAEK